MKITFDSNVWERLVEAKERENSKYTRLKSLIKQGKIEAYICEIAISLESIMKKDRLSFWNDYEPRIEHETVGSISNDDGSTTIQCRMMFAPNNDKHPSLHPKLLNNLELANRLGFRVLRMTNFGTVRTTQIPEEMQIDFDDLDAFWEYAEKVSNLSNYIKEIECGSYEYFRFETENNLHGISVSKIIQSIDKSQKNQFAKAVAEWVDGDSLAAHHASGNSVFCTEDRGKSAGSGSVFSAENLLQIQKSYDIQVLSIDEVLKLFP